MTNYTIISDPSGTSEKEIKRAKQLFRKGVKTGRYNDALDVEIRFVKSDGYAKIVFIDLFDHTKITEIQL